MYIKSGPPLQSLTLVAVATQSHKISEACLELFFLYLVNLCLIFLNIPLPQR